MKKITSILFVVGAVVVNIPYALLIVEKNEYRQWKTVK
jgi:hypothetical protein